MPFRADITSISFILFPSPEMQLIYTLDKHPYCYSWQTPLLSVLRRQNLIKCGLGSDTSNPYLSEQRSPEYFLFFFLPLKPCMLLIYIVDQCSGTLAFNLRSYNCMLSNFLCNLVLEESLHHVSTTCLPSDCCSCFIRWTWVEIVLLLVYLRISVI